MSTGAKITRDNLFEGLTGKQAAWLRAYLDSSNPNTFQNGTGSARAAGYKASSDTAFRVIGAENFAKLSKRISVWIDEVGLSPEKLKLKLLSLVEAKETKFFAHRGKVVDQIEVESIETQRRALDMALKVKGLYAPVEATVTVRDTIPAEDKALLRDIAKELGKRVVGK